MPSKRLYLQPIPEGAQLQDTDALQANLSAQGLLDGGSAVEQLSSGPGDHTLRGQYRCRTATDARLMARELRELANASGFDAVPFYEIGDEDSDDGYYVVERAENVGPVEPQEPAIQQFRLSLSEAGTTKDRFLAVETTPSQVDHTFGNNTTPVISVDDRASKLRWYNPDDGTVASADPLDTVEGEHGTLARFDVDAGETAVGTGQPTLLYELGYAEQGPLDPVVWDGRDASKLDADGVRQWQHVFTTGHEYAGRPVLDNALLRLFVDEAAGVLEAERWDDANTTWSAVGLDWSTTDWALYDWDAEATTSTVVRAQGTFVHPDNGLFSLDAALHRGFEDVQFSIPENESGPIPSELETVLDPIASPRLVDPQPKRALVRRSEVRK
ncbi:MAG: hypothetical protein ACI8XM_000928 [Haloarculaceae archaeon]|jgi:hypothetical protein